MRSLTRSPSCARPLLRPRWGPQLHAGFRPLPDSCIGSAAACFQQAGWPVNVGSWCQLYFPEPYSALELWCAGAPHAVQNSHEAAGG